MSDCDHWYLDEFGYECCNIYGYCEEGEYLECPPTEEDFEFDESTKLITEFMK